MGSWSVLVAEVRKVLTLRKLVRYIDSPLPFSGSNIKNMGGILANWASEVLILLKLIVEELAQMVIGHGLELLLVGRAPILSLLQTLVAAPIFDHTSVNGRGHTGPVTEQLVNVLLGKVAEGSLTTLNGCHHMPNHSHRCPVSS